MEEDEFELVLVNRAVPEKAAGGKEEEEEEEEEGKKKDRKREKVGFSPPEGGPVSRKRPKRSSEKTYSSFHLTARELAGPAKVVSKPSESGASVAGDGSQPGPTERESFSSAGASARLGAACEKVGLRAPTSVQRASLQALSRDEAETALVVAPTGSGKTLAYALPVLDTLQGRTRTQGVGCVVVAPTRELCAQICGAFTKVGRVFDVGLVCGAVTGGERRKSEKARLRKGLVIVCATPGRLLDHLQQTASLGHSLAGLQWLVLDEVDRLLDLGFGPQIDDVISRLDRCAVKKNKRRTVVVTATADRRVRALAAKHLGPDYRVVRGRVVDRDLAAAASSSSSPDRGGKAPLVEETPRMVALLVDDRASLPATLTLEFAVVTLKLRLPSLAGLLRSRRASKTLVFVSTRASAEFHAGLARLDATLAGDRAVDCLHGDMDRIERKAAYDRFCLDAGNPVLFATDVAARGLDFADARVDWVLHLDPPRDVSTLIHRSGRAARAGRQGTATLLVLPSERKGLLDAVRARGLEPPARTGVPSLATDGSYAMADAAAADALRGFEQAVANSAELLTRARDAFAAHVRAYAGKADANLVSDADEKAALARAFNVRKLHLGHAAKAFALTEAPRTVAAKQRSFQRAFKRDAKSESSSEKKRNQQTRPQKYETAHFTTRVLSDGTKAPKLGGWSTATAASKRRKLRPVPLHMLDRTTAPPSFHVSEFGA